MIRRFLYWIEASMMLALGLAFALPQPAEAAGKPITVTLEAEAPEGTPPGVTKEAFLAARGTMTLALLPGGKAKVSFAFKGLQPNGLYTYWEIYSLSPKKDRPLGAYGKHVLRADDKGQGKGSVIVDHWPVGLFFLDYHADGKIEQNKGFVYGVLKANFPPQPAQ